MKKKNDKLIHAAHIKRHTVGTSNEISFSVLDAAKDALDGKGRVNRDARLPRFGVISLFTLPVRRKKPAGTPTKEQGLTLSTGDFVSAEDSEPRPSHVVSTVLSDIVSEDAPSAGSEAVEESAAPLPEKPTQGSALTPEEEVARRKARRRLSKLLVYTATSLIVGVLVIVGGWWLYDGYRQHQSNIAYLNDTLSLIAETDEAINRLDDLIADPFAVDSSDAYEEVESSLSEIEEKLDRADERAREASATLRESKAAEAAQQAIETISARYVLIDQGGRIVDAAERAYASIERAREAWDKLLSADASARESSDLVKDTTPENVRSSIDKANEALENFGEAERLFQEAQALYGVDFSMFGDYIAKREEALRYAITSDEAILAKDKVAAIKGNDLYNAADAQAAAYVKSLPDDPSSPVIDAYESDIDAFENAYSTARLQAGAADAFIRDYLGTEIK